jgi:hypothetical protein
VDPFVVRFFGEVNEVTGRGARPAQSAPRSGTVDARRTDFAEGDAR